MIRRRVDTLALGWAIAFLLLAILLGLAWANDAGAATSQRVNVKRAAARVLAAERAEWRRHDKRGHGFAAWCRFADVRGKGARRTGEPVECTFTVWRRADRTGRPLAVLAFAASVVPRQHRHSKLGEDGAGEIVYSAARSLGMDERPPRAP